ncbi:MAG: putative Ig domain-containing protein, partial [Steroidobacteraceae bacterium]
MKSLDLVKRSIGALSVVLLGLVAFAGPASAAIRTNNGISYDDNTPQIQRGVPYSYQIAEPTGGGGGPYTFEEIGGTLPPGIFLNSSGGLFGVSCDSFNGTYYLELQITSATG